MKIKTNGVMLNAEVEGREGAPWLTFSNSLATDLTMWDAQAKALAARYRILRYDKRGHGKSDAPPGPYDLPMLVKDVIGLWDHLGIDRSHFVGLSIGGMTALGLGIDHADRLISIVPCDCRADSPPEFRAEPLYRRQPVVLAWRVLAIIEAQLDAARASYSRARADLRDTVTPEVVAETLQALEREGAGLLARRREVDLVSRALRGEEFVPRL